MILCVCFHVAEQKKLLRKPPEQLEKSRILKVAIIGAPNAGKSTLANMLMGWRVRLLYYQLYFFIIHSSRCLMYWVRFVEHNGSGVELRTLSYENPGSNPVLRC